MARSPSCVRAWTDTGASGAERGRFFMGEAWGWSEDPDAAQTRPAEKGPAVGQYLAFRLGREEYAVDVLRVQEIRGMCTVTSIPNARPWVLGMMNLRGAVVAVLDLRAK